MKNHTGDFALSRRLMIGAGVAAWLTPAAVSAQQKTMPLVGYIEPIAENTPTNAVNLAGFRKGLAAEGFVEGKNVTVVYRYADGQIDRLPALAAELVKLNPDVLFTNTPNAARPAKALTTSIPIVFAQAADAVENGEVTNLAHPEANLTGIANFNELSPMRLDLLCRTVPAADTIAVLADPQLGSFARNLAQVEAEAGKLGKKLVLFKASTDADFMAAFAAITEQKIKALFVAPVRGAYSRPAQIVAMAASHPVPTMYYDRAFVDAGGLMSYGAAFTEISRQAGVYVGKILKGAKPGDLPVLRTNAFELVLNMKAAKALALAIPPKIAAMASEIIR